MPVYLLPHPVTILQAGLRYIFGTPGQGPYAGRFLGDFTASLTRVLLGFCLAAAAGIPLGLLSGRVALVNRLVSAPSTACGRFPVSAGCRWR